MQVKQQQQEHRTLYRFFIPKHSLSHLCCCYCFTAFYATLLHFSEVNEREKKQEREGWEGKVKSRECILYPSLKSTDTTMIGLFLSSFFYLFLLSHVLLPQSTPFQKRFLAAVGR